MTLVMAMILTVRGVVLVGTTEANVQSKVSCAITAQVNFVPTVKFLPGGTACCEENGRVVQVMHTCTATGFLQVVVGVGYSFRQVVAATWRDDGGGL